MLITKPHSKFRARLTSQGQITVPKAVRDELGVKSGDELEFVHHPDGLLIRHRPRVNVLDFAGLASAAAARIPATAEELDAVLHTGGAERAAKRDAMVRAKAALPPQRNRHD